jgi:hypothetical protein
MKEFSFVRILRIFFIFSKKLIKHKMLQANVYFVGAGLSDIELITETPRGGILL